MIFFGKRMHFLFAAVMSIPIWLATNTYIDDLPVSEDEAVSTGITMCFFAGIFTGRYLAEVWKPHTLFRPRRLLAVLSVFIILCLSWLFIHADNPLPGRGVNMLLYLLPFLTMSLAIGILIKAVRAFAEKELTEARSSATRSRAELQLLQSQLSPHFLFNTLNNMYGLSLTQHEKLPPLLLRLSDLLRYSVYNTGETFVPLKDEVEYIRNYMEFEKIRLSDRLALTADIDTPADDKTLIAPMLLIVFIENAFKHSRNTAHKNIAIDISLKTWHDMILFFVKIRTANRKKALTKTAASAWTMCVKGWNCYTPAHTGWI